MATTVTITGAGGQIDGLAIWGNHSATQFPDVSHARLRGEPGGGYRTIEGLSIDDRSRARIDASVAELVAERDAVRALGAL